MMFFVGLHHPADSRHFDLACVSINALARNAEGYPPPRPAGGWILDSGAFTQVTRHGRFLMSEGNYARHIARYHSAGESGLYGGPMLAAVSQDYMCEPPALKATGCTVARHHAMTIARYDNILQALDKRGCNAYLMPVLQGQSPADYVRHLQAYGPRIESGAWIGVGSVCKRNGSPAEVLDILASIHAVRSDLRLHGFGLKKTALENPNIVRLLYSSDSMAWSFAARREGRDANDWREAAAYAAHIEEIRGNNKTQHHKIEKTEEHHGNET